MTEEYQKRLIQLTKDFIEFREKEIILRADDENNDNFIMQREIKYEAKLNYLLGYIMALEPPTHEKH